MVRAKRRSNAQCDEEDAEPANDFEVGIEATIRWFEIHFFYRWLWAGSSGLGLDRTTVGAIEAADDEVNGPLCMDAETIVGVVVGIVRNGIVEPKCSPCLLIPSCGSGYLLWLHLKTASCLLRK